MHRVGSVLASLCLGFILAVPAAQAGPQEGPFLGVDLGYSTPQNDNYRAHVQSGFTANPFAGYMFNKYLGLMVQGHFTFQSPDNDHRAAQYIGFNNENQWTSVLGATGGPRLDIPLGEMAALYITAQGGGFQGVSGRLDGRGGPGFSLGGGLDIYATDNFSIGAFGRFNHAYIAPRPFILTNQVAADQGPSDARWVTVGLSLKGSFGHPAPPPPPPRVAQAPPPPPPPPPPPTKKKIVLRSVHFDFDKATLRSDALPVLNEAINTLKQEGSVDIVVEGYTDSVGTDAYNQKLSDRRAKSVREYLVKHGISPSRITTKGYGETHPVASNETAEGRQQNRRVELHVQ